MNIYNVSKTRLIIIWVVVLLIWLSTFIIENKFGLQSSRCGLFCYLAFPIILISYTFGWKKWKGVQLNEHNSPQVVKYSLLTMTLPIVLLVLFDWLVLKMPLGEITGFTGF